MVTTLSIVITVITLIFYICLKRLTRTPKVCTVGGYTLAFKIETICSFSDIRISKNPEQGFVENTQSNRSFELQVDRIYFGIRKDVPLFRVFSKTLIVVDGVNLVFCNPNNDRRGPHFKRRLSEVPKTEKKGKKRARVSLSWTQRFLRVFGRGFIVLTPLRSFELRKCSVKIVKNSPSDENILEYYHDIATVSLSNEINRIKLSFSPDTVLSREVTHKNSIISVTLVGLHLRTKDNVFEFEDTIRIMLGVSGWYYWSVKKLKLLLSGTTDSVTVIGAPSAFSNVGLNNTLELATDKKRSHCSHSGNTLCNQLKLQKALLAFKNFPVVGLALKVNHLTLKHQFLVDIYELSIEATFKTKSREIVANFNAHRLLVTLCSDEDNTEEIPIEVEGGIVETLLKLNYAQPDKDKSGSIFPASSTVRVDSCFQIIKLRHSDLLLEKLKPQVDKNPNVGEVPDCCHKLPELDYTLFEITSTFSVLSLTLETEDKGLPLFVFMYEPCINSSLSLSPQSCSSLESLLAYIQVNLCLDSAKLVLLSNQDSNSGMPEECESDCKDIPFITVHSLSVDFPILTMCKCSGALQINHLRDVPSGIKICSKFISIFLDKLSDSSDQNRSCFRKEFRDLLKLSVERSKNKELSEKLKPKKMIREKIFKQITTTADSIVVSLPSHNQACGLELCLSNITFDLLGKSSLWSEFELEILGSEISSFKKRERRFIDRQTLSGGKIPIIRKCVDLQCLRISPSRSEGCEDIASNSLSLNLSLQCALVDVDITSVYLFIDSFLPIIKLNNLLRFDGGSREQLNRSTSFNICGSADVFRVNVDLCSEEKVEVGLKGTSISLTNSMVELLSSKVSLNVPEIDLPNDLKILSMSKFGLKMALNCGRDCPISVSVARLVLCISREYKAYRLTLGLSVFRKCLKRMYDIYFSSTLCSVISGNLPPSRDKARSYTLNSMIGNFEVIFTSDWFSDRIYRNYLLGLLEQPCRLKREDEVKKRILDLKDKKGEDESLSISGVMKIIQEKLDIYNSGVWKKRIDDYEKQIPEYIPKLLTAVSNNVSLTLKSLGILETSIGAYIHKLDPLTHSSTFWDNVMPMHISLKLNDFVIKLRNYPHDFLNVPFSESGYIKCTGAIIIADKYPIKNARQPYAVNLPLLNLPSLKVTRNINPIMMYHDLETEISAHKPIIVSWGASHDPSLIEVIDVIDNFSIIKEDPSPPIGWWDKMRLMFHGRNKIKFTEETEVRLRMLGSYFPHFRSSVDWGAEGVELCIRGKTHIEMCSIDEMTISTSGLVIRLIPETYLTSEDLESAKVWKNKLIMNLCGNVKAVISLKFITNVKDHDGNDYIRTHNDIHLSCAGLLERDAAKSHDSYKGFRTRGIKIVANLVCNDSKSTNSGHISNFCSLFNYSIMEKMSKMACVYQPPLINILTKFKNRKESNNDYNKPVFLQNLETVYASVEISPLKALIFSECDDFSEVKIKATTKISTSEVLVVKKSPFTLETSSKHTDKIESGSSSQWIISNLTLAFSDIIAWVSCVPLIVVNESSLDDQEKRRPSYSGSLEEKLKHMNFGIPYINPTKRDMDYATYYSNKKIPFVWSNNVIYSVKPTWDMNLPEGLETGSDTAFTYPGIYPTQAKICEERLEIIDKIIESTKKTYSQSTQNYGNSKRNLNDISETLKALEGKKDILREKIKSYKHQYMHNSSNDAGISREVEDVDGQHDCYVHSRPYRNELLVHNIRILWNEEVRNLIYNLVFCRADRKDENFCGSVFSLQSVYKLVESISYSFGSIKQVEASRRVSVMLKPKFTFKKKANDSNFTQWTLKDARKLLKKLESEKKISFMTHENVGTANRSWKCDTPLDTSASLNINGREYPQGESYIPIRPISKCGDSSHGVSDIYPHLKVEFINPQICFNSYYVDNPDVEHYTYATGDKILLFIDRILHRGLDYEYSRKYYNIDEITIKSSICSTMYNAQFYCGEKFQILKDYLSDIERVISFRGSFDREKDNNQEVPWVPIERILDTSAPLTYLNRVAEAKIATFRYVWPNLLFTKLSCSFNDSYYIEKQDLNIPDLSIWLDSDQYFIIHELISNLFLYEHPRANENNDRLQSALILLEKSPNMLVVIGSAFALGKKIRKIRETLKGKTYRNMIMSTKPPDPETLQSYKSLRDDLREYRVELSVIINALKTIHSYMSNVEADISMYKKFRVSIVRCSWIMINNDNAPFLECNLTNLTTGYNIFRGQSLLNYLELDNLNIKYLESPNPFDTDDFISPYFPNSKTIDSSRHKIIRVYWKENAPVTGIKVIEHFEINLFPISLKLTYSLGKRILKYFFPHKSTHQGSKFHKAKKTEITHSNLNPDVHSFVAPACSSRDVRIGEDSVSSYLDKPLPTEEKPPLQKSASCVHLQTGAKMKQLGQPNSSYFNLKLGLPVLMSIIQQNKQKRTNEEDYASVHHAYTAKEKNETHPQIMEDMSDIKQMQARAREYRSFIYIKIPGVEHCLSYRRSLDRNFEDLEDFVFRFPTLEFRNKTWSWTDLFYAVKKECLRILIINTGAIVKEKIFSRKRIDKR